MPRRLSATHLGWIPAFALGSFLLTPITAVAQEVAEPKEGWQFEITPYFSTAGSSGQNGIRGYNSDVDMSFKDLLELTTISGMGTVEVKKGPWLVYFDGQYVRLEDEQVTSATGPGGWVTVTGDLAVGETQQIYQVSAGYRVLDRRAKVYLLGGMRYTDVDIDLDLALSTDGPLFPGAAYHLDGGASWWDPFVAMRLEAPFAKKWSVFGYADVGGFGVGSDLTYQPVAGVNWQISRVFSAKVAYRYLSQDYESDDFLWNMATQGLVLGVGLRF